MKYQYKNNHRIRQPVLDKNAQIDIGAHMVCMPG